jgi:hypothetical protein
MEACVANPPFPYYGVDGSRSGDSKKRLQMLHLMPVNPAPAKLQMDLPAV